MHASRPEPGGSSSNASKLRRVFVQRVHRLLQLGYERLTPNECVSEQETSITGFLVEAIDTVLCDRAEPWMTNFAVHDDPPVNDGRRKGKQRKRVDLRIDSGRFRPRARYRFEAKRLGKGHSVKKYLGKEGLGCFLRGDYSSEEDEAGMLGYVQRDDVDVWGGKIAHELGARPSNYAVDTAFQFTSHSMLNTPWGKSYHSKHHRETVGRPILISHTLLQFH